MKFWFALVFALLGFAAAQAEEASIALPSGENLANSRYPAQGSELLLWFASERGLTHAEIQAARDLSAKGTTVWQFDLTAALFLPQTNSSMDGVGVRDVQAIIAEARRTGANIAVYAVNRAAVPVLRALAGTPKLRTRVLLMHPHFYSRVDTLVGADYLSFGNLRGADVLILQPRRSAATPWVSEQIAALRKQGAKVQLLMLDDVRERYWARESPTDFEVAEGKRLAESMVIWRNKLK
jgi:hypothetical protein